MSEKRKKLLEEVGPERADYSDGACQICGGGPCVVHEIARGPARHAALSERAAWLRVCQRCHDRCGDYSDFPIERQLAAKLLADPEHFSLEKIHELRGRAAEAIELAEVVQYLILED